MKRVAVTAPATKQQPSLKKPATTQSPLKRQNATLSTQSMNEEISTQEDTSISMDEGTYFKWSVRALTPDEILNLKQCGWGEYLCPREENMRISVGLCRQGANEGRYFLSIGHPNLNQFGFATFLDGEMSERTDWWGKPKASNAPTLQSLQLQIQILQNEVNDLKNCI